jgi:Tfp pilus assembly protein PilE
MPCYSTITIQVEFKASSSALLRAALEAEGYNVSANGEALVFSHIDSTSGSWRNGKLNITEGADVNAIRTAYSRAAVKEAARRCGWTFVPAGKSRAVIERRY